MSRVQIPSLAPLLFYWDAPREFSARHILIHKISGFEPEQTIIRPRMRMIEWRLVRQAHAVSALFINLQRERHMVFPQRSGEHQRVFHRHGLVLERRPQKT